jgi:hypothetical protein
MVYTGQLNTALNVAPGSFTAAQLGQFTWVGAPSGTVGPTAFYAGGHPNKPGSRRPTELHRCGKRNRFRGCINY